MDLHYQEYGEGDPLLVLHGLFGSGDNWRTLGRRFSASYRTFLLDLRNHGDSFHSDTFDFPAMAGDINRFISSRELSKVVVMGHSMGGKVAMVHALTHPEQVERLVIVDIAPRAYPAAHDDILEALCRIDPGTIQTRKDAEQALSVDIRESAVRQFLLKNLERLTDGTYRWKMNLPVIEARYDEIRKGIENDARYEGPALFVRGGRSPYVTDDDLPGILALFPEAQLVTIPSAGHWVHAEAPEDFYEAVITFLQE